MCECVCVYTVYSAAYFDWFHVHIRIYVSIQIPMYTYTADYKEYTLFINRDVILGGELLCSLFLPFSLVNFKNNNMHLSK